VVALFHTIKSFHPLTKEELKRFIEISEVIEVIELNNLSPERIRAYELYLDNIRTRENTIYEAKMEVFTEGEARRKAIGETVGESKGIIKGNNQTLSIIKDLKDSSNTIESISEKYGVSVEFVREIQSVMG
jgi:predicted transposase YdaD